jgi:hypothetical protein
MDAKKALVSKMAEAKKPTPKPTPKNYKGPFGKDISKVVPFSKEWYKLANTKGID